MIINAKEKLWQIQKKFHTLFPNLRLEYRRLEENERHHPFYLNKTLYETSKVEPEKMIILEKTEKPAVFKNEFQNTFKLKVKIFKRNGIRWSEVEESENMYLNDIDRACGSY